MKNHIPTFALLSFLLFFGCGKSAPSQDGGEATATSGGAIDYDAMAKDLCACMTPMMDFQNKLMALLAEGKEDEIMAMQEDALAIQQEGEACVDALEAKYGVVGPEQEEEATEALRKACPEFMEMVEGTSEFGDIPLGEPEEDGQ